MRGRMRRGRTQSPSSASGRQNPKLPNLVGFHCQKSIEKAAGLILWPGPAALVNLTIQDRQSAPPHNLREVAGGGASKIYPYTQG